MSDDQPRNYPVPRPGHDPRFTLGLGLDVADVLKAHGYPEVTGRDIVELQSALFGFLYGDGRPATAEPVARQARIPAEHCPACGEVFHPEWPGTGARCRRCQHEGRPPRDAVDGPGW